MIQPERREPLPESASSPPLVTVFVACYNHSRFVVEALESVRIQHYPRVQLIVADDCSKDDSAKVIREWLGRYWPDALFIHHPRNQGICPTFNEILGHAKGKYISGFAADDVWLPGRLRAQVEWMEAQPEDVGVLYGDAYQIDENGTRLPKRFIAAHRPLATMPEGWVFDALLGGNFIPAMTTLVRRQCFVAVGGYDESLAFEDWDMWLRISRQFQFRFWPHLSASYRVLSTSLLRTQSQAIRHSAERVLIKCLHMGWLTGGTRAVALGMEHAHAMQHYQQKSPGWFRAVWQCCRRHPSPQNLFLLSCGVMRLPARWHAAVLSLAKRTKRTPRPWPI